MQVEPIQTTAPRSDSHADYERVRQAILYIAAHRDEQPTLRALSEELGVSESHLQRVFSRWAGISPKRFLQYLTKEHARTLLAETTVLDAAISAGLSSTGRLHDLMIACDAITPGDVRSRGEGLAIEYGVHDTPFGACFIATTERGICKLAFVDSASQQRLVETELRAAWSSARIIRDDDATATVAARVFSPNLREKQPLHILLKGTNFQIKVWEALLAIPPGGVADYGSVARLIGAPSAARAVGTAIAKNHIAYLIPCHRVIRKTGDFGQYRWGAERKQALIAWESARRAS